ncbi:conserved hypothetical protein [Neospora caninum Liverpool]|uniref:Uncharacterized protein n=1 Tax=Neospora caninum (strain Liverpool) TaxID=572307 RepID=F0VLN6_NEOCL|nr:conserved hypothetical protein [Neospora caninum Liverpool]CBZ54164.1 conserved hypothetical protein [Neospora caninum Liverpool]CEL68865.1 TPA: hypothetical protein BN1204_045960 [Neospora caninum Liverpool]|eukprot:XP_003884195.1 conserved hypothetical protein [Neospora caninum Liverpool]
MEAPQQRHSDAGEAPACPASAEVADGLLPCERLEKCLPLPPRLETALQSLLHGLDRTVNAWQVQQLFLFQQELSAFHASLQEQAGALDEEAQRFLETGVPWEYGTSPAVDSTLPSRLFSLLIRTVLRSIVNRPLFEEAASPASPCSSSASTATAHSSSKCSFFEQIRRFSLLLHVSEERTLLANCPSLPSLKLSDAPQSSPASPSHASLHTLLLSAQASLKAKRAAVEQLFSFLHDSELQTLLLTPSIPDLAALDLLKIDASIRAILPSLRRTASALADATAREALLSSSLSGFPFAVSGQENPPCPASSAGVGVGDCARQEGNSRRDGAECKDVGVEKGLAEGLLALWTTSLQRFLQTSLGVYVHTDATDEQQNLVDLAFVGLSPAEFTPRLLEQFLAYCSTCQELSLSRAPSGPGSCFPCGGALPQATAESGQVAPSCAGVEQRKRKRTECERSLAARGNLDVLREVLVCCRDFLASLFHTVNRAWSTSEQKAWRLRDEARDAQTEGEGAFYAALVEAASLGPSFAAFVEPRHKTQEGKKKAKSRRTTGHADEQDTPAFLPFHFRGPGEGRPSLVDVLLSQRGEAASLPSLLDLVCGLVDLLLEHAVRGIDTAQCPSCSRAFAPRENRELCSSFGSRSGAVEETREADGGGDSVSGLSGFTAGLTARNVQPVFASVSDGEGPRSTQTESEQSEPRTKRRARDRDAEDETETVDLESLQTCIPLAFSLCGAFLKLLRFCVDIGSPLSPSFSLTLSRFSSSPAAPQAQSADAFVAEATWAVLHRCMHLECLASHLSSSASVLCTQPRRFLVDGEELRDEAVEEQLAEQTANSPFSLTSLFGAMQADEDFRRDVYAVCAFDPKFRFVLYRLPYSLALGALEFLSVHAPKEARRRWPLYVLLGSVCAADEGKQDGAWLEAAVASALMQAPSPRSSSFLVYPNWCAGRNRDKFETGAQGAAEAGVNGDLDAFSAAALYKELLAAASECEDFVPQRLVFLGLARTLAVGPRVASPNTTQHLQQQLRHLQLRAFPASSLPDDLALDMLAANLQCWLLGRCRGVMDKVEIFEQALALVEKRLNEDFAKSRLFALRTLRELARLLPSLLLSEAMTRPLFIKFWTLVFTVDASAFLPLAAHSENLHNGASRATAGKEDGEASAAPADVGPLLETLFYELICRFGPCLLALQPNAAPPDENVFAALHSLLPPTDNGAAGAGSGSLARVNGAESGAKQRGRELALRDVVLLLLTFYAEKQHELAKAARVPLTRGSVSPRQAAASSELFPLPDEFAGTR